MMPQPYCDREKCIHYRGFPEQDWDDKPLLEPESERVFCDAFPTGAGIPSDIVYGRNRHLAPTLDQRNDIVYERRSGE